jgi:four helix bundle protein
MKTLNTVQVWNRACDLSIQIHNSLEPCKDAAMRDAITRTSVDVAAKIAQGYELKTRQHCWQWLANARGSCAALRTRLYIASELDVLDSERSFQLINETLEISTQLDELLEQYQVKYCPWN